MRQLEHCAIIAVLTATFAGALKCPAREPAATHDPREAELQQILAAWNERSTAIWALDATQSLSQAIRGSGEQSIPPDTLKDPFADIPAPKDDALIRSRTELLLCKGQAAMTATTKVQSHRDPNRWTPQTLRFSIDGDERRTLYEQEPPLQATVDFTRNEHGVVFMHQPCLPIFLWLRPEGVIRQSQWLFDEMYVEEHDVVVEGTKCRRIVIPHKHEHWLSTIDVDPQRGLIPLRWETRLQGKSTSLLTIEFRQDAVVGFVPSGWVNKFAGSEPTHAEVAINSINQEIPEDRLSVTLPDGTFVTKSKGGIRTYGIQRDGGLEKLDRKRFMKELSEAQKKIPSEI